MSANYDCIVTKRRCKNNSRILLVMILILTLITGYLYVKNAQLERKVEEQTKQIWEIKFNINKPVNLDEILESGGLKID